MVTYQSTQLLKQKIISFYSWIQAWNVYLAVCIDHMPSQAPSLVAYQHFIITANTLHPLESWLNYDVQFQILVASNPTLRWDTRHPDILLQCITPASVQKFKQWPCPYCGAVTHFPDHHPFVPALQNRLPIDNIIRLEDNYIHNLLKIQPFKKNLLPLN